MLGWRGRRLTLGVGRWVEESRRGPGGDDEGGSGRIGDTGIIRDRCGFAISMRQAAAMHMRFDRMVKKRLADPCFVVAACVPAVFGGPAKRCRQRLPSSLRQASALASQAVGERVVPRSGHHAVTP